MKNHEEKNQLLAGELSPKVIALYHAVSALMAEGEDISEMKVVDITKKAGIGKGTAYEYFTNKEELICYAILYHVDRICGQIERKLEAHQDFQEGINEILDSMEREIEDKDCFIRFIHLLSDTSGTGRTLKNLAAQYEDQLILPERLVHKLVQIGLKNGEICSKLPVEYIGFAMASRILCYILFISGNNQVKSLEKRKMRELLCNGLYNELGQKNISL